MPAGLASPTGTFSETVVSSSGKKPYRIGYVPLTDCASLIAAQELDIFEKNGLSIHLSPEAGWATVREKMLHGELDAAHAPASMVLEMNNGWGGLQVPTVTGLVTAYHGNGITLSNELWEMGVRHARDLRALIQKERGRRFTFAGVLKFSSQHYQMRKWLRRGGIDPDRDVDLAIVPPPMVFRCLENGHLDGYCVAEPWNSIGSMQKRSWCVELSADLDPGHPEKVFLTRRSFAEEKKDDYIAMLASLMESAAWCDNPANRKNLITLLSQREYLDLPRDILGNAFGDEFVQGHGKTRPRGPVIFYGGEDHGRPGLRQADWIRREIEAHKLRPSNPPLSDQNLRECFRVDLHEAARQIVFPSQNQNTKQNQHKT